MSVQVVQPLTLKVAEACRLAGFGQTKLRADIKDGKVPGVIRWGRHIYLLRDEFERWVRTQSTVG